MESARSSRSLYVAKGTRLFAFGMASVALPVHLAATGVAPLWIGAILALALLSGAAQLLFSGFLSRRFGIKPIALAVAVAMGLGGLLAATDTLWIIVLAAALGALNATAHDSGPLFPLEQASLATGEHGVHRMAVYNAVGTASLALGTLAGGALQFRLAFLLYGLCGGVIVLLYAFAPLRQTLVRPRTSHVRRFGIAERLAALFAVDAFAGGLIVQGFLAYWLVLRYHVHPQAIGVVLAAGNVLSALSLFAAARLAKRFGLLNTMVFTHLPSNILLALVPLAPSFPIAAGLLLARYSLSQMDVPTRQAFVVASVPEEERIYAAGITSAVRPLAAATSPFLAAVAMQAAAVGAPFFAAAGIKACYDIAVYIAFRRVREISPTS
ncbi:MAG: MFS transporter [Vulcanimicrobiaceae bacterium]